MAPSPTTPPIHAPTAPHAPLADHQYRKRPVYEMQWQLSELGDYMLCGAPYGGSIAVVHVSATKQTITSLSPPSAASSDQGSTLQIYTSSGGLLTTIAWRSPAWKSAGSPRIVSMGWSDQVNRT